MRPALALVLLIGCADHGAEGMFVLNNSAPPVGMCTFTGDPMQPFIAHGSIVATSPAGYLLSPLIESRLTAITGSEAEKTIHLEGAKVTLSVANASGSLTNLTQYTTLFSGSVAPNGGTTNVSFELIPAGELPTIAAQGANVEVSANIAIYGTEGGGDVQAEPFDYPVTVCTNCIVVDHGACPMPSTDMNLGNACNPFQDGSVDCCHDVTTNALLCPGPTG